MRDVGTHTLHSDKQVNASGREDDDGQRFKNYCKLQQFCFNEQYCPFPQPVRHEWFLSFRETTFRFMPHGVPAGSCSVVGTLICDIPTCCAKKKEVAVYATAKNCYITSLGNDRIFMAGY